jgi:thiol-disulfide isomerase/thioredoxin
MRARTSASCAALVVVVASLLATSSPSLAEPAAAAVALAAEPAAAPAAASSPEVVPATASQVLDAVKKSGSRLVIVNLWATWCTPCREEFPDLMRVYNAFKDRGVSLVLVSGDFSSDAGPAREFLASQGVTVRSYLKQGPDEEFINAFDPAWSGALPATFLYNDKGEKVHSFLGPITYESLAHEVEALAGSTAP